MILLNINAVISAHFLVFRFKKIRRSNIKGDVPESNYVVKNIETIEYSYEHPIVADSTEQVIVIVEVHL